MSRIHLIIVDGLDGVGKDTHANLIKKRYETMGKTVIIRSHPAADSVYGRKTKQALLGKGKRNRLRASVFYALDVLHSLRQYYYREAECDVLIMVRYLMGTAYLPTFLASLAYTFFSLIVPTSQSMFFLDAPPKVLFHRLQQRTEQEMFETLENLVKVRKRALLLATGWHIIDTTGSVNDTFVRIEKILNQLDAQ